MTYKIFTLGEANETLEEVVRPAFRRLHAGLERLARAEQETDILELIVETGADATNPDRARHDRLSRGIRALKAEIRDEVGVIRATGAFVKDLRRGLVDFFALREGQLVFLCWRRGEDRIGFWHPLEAGFRGRRPLREQAELEDEPRTDGPLG